MTRRDRESRQVKAKYRKLLRELRYLYSELDYYAEEHGHRKKEFAEDLEFFCEEFDYDCTTLKTAEEYQKKQVDPYRQEVTSEESDEIQDDVEQGTEDEPADPDDAEKDLKTLYRKIATQTHPDKLINEEVEAARERKKRLFLEAREALENKDYYKLSQVADELGIELPRPTRQQLVWMRKEKKKIEKTIKSITETYEWVYGEAEAADARNNIFHSYVKVIGCVKRKEIKI